MLTSRRWLVILRGHEFNCCFGVSMPRTLKSYLQTGQFVGNRLLSDNVRGCSIT